MGHPSTDADIQNEDELFIQRKALNQLNRKRNIRTAYVLSGLVGWIAVTITWYNLFTDTAILISIAITAVLVFILSLYIRRLKSLTCPKCSAYFLTDRISRIQHSTEMTPKGFGNQILFITKYRCRVCGHFWYIHKYESQGGD